MQVKVMLFYPVFLATSVLLDSRFRGNDEQRLMIVTFHRELLFLNETV